MTSIWRGGIPALCVGLMLAYAQASYHRPETGEQYPHRATFTRQPSVNSTLSPVIGPFGSLRAKSSSTGRYTPAVLVANTTSGRLGAVAFERGASLLTPSTDAAYFHGARPPPSDTETEA